MKIGAIIIGDEILNGKRRDRHFAQCQAFLAERGLELSWSIFVGDDADDLARFLSFSMSSHDLVFSFGGIGATPDDRTRQTVADVNKVPLNPHPQAVAEIEAQFGEQAYPKRILMGYLPEGSEIIPNPVNRVPGFSFGHHHFMPGFPEMAWPMMQWVLDERYPHLRNLRPETEQIIFIYKGRESELIDDMQQVIEQFPSIRLSSLPCMQDNPHIELTIRGQSDVVQQAMAFMIQAVETKGFSWSVQLTDNH